MPILDLETVKAAGVSRFADSRQRQRAAYYNRSDVPFAIEDAEKLGVEPLPANFDWFVGLSAIPADQSSAIVIGRIVNRKAFLSEDGKAVYSEYAIAIEEVLKRNFEIRSEATAIRYGGAVKLKSGKIHRYEIHGQHPPLLNKRYLLFLNQDKALSIVTGYELTNGFASPLDGKPQDGLPFEAFRSIDESQFLDNVRAAVKGGKQ